MQQKPHDITERLAYLDITEGMRRADRIVNGLMVAVPLETTVEGEEMDDWNAEDYPLPEWVEKRSDGNYMERGAQLSTRDGRRLGNAYVDAIQQHDRLGQLAVVVTDMGNAFHMTIRELEEAFYPPAYVMRLDEARARRGVMPNVKVSGLPQPDGD